MRPRRVPVSLPNPWLPGADWADRHELLLFAERMTAAEAALRALRNAAGWLRSFGEWRNCVAVGLGLNAAPQPTQSDLIGSIPIMYSGDRETVVGYDARHLHFRIVVDVRDGPADGQVIGMTTLVRRRSAIGWLFFAAAIPLHKAIAPALLRGVARPGQGFPGER
ncbi:hypothetical protein ATC00_12505 [Sinorhizobium americanum]|uniref:DUF2867 domain-containing protein n=2 Tax=Sinorhizobium americanum TaxID=194963 RepID=UPI000566E10E|nr:DUF2867 domain-containing protein [Sinorhizobium americanum]OAP38715.1 hypothetical protein ATC00_12505 [Sinorhizobium americanum]